MISIILPVFNREKILGKFIESAISQTYRDFEIIVIDDDSTDNSYNVAAEYAEKKCSNSLFQTPKKFRSTCSEKYGDKTI